MKRRLFCRSGTGLFRRSFLLLLLVSAFSAQAQRLFEAIENPRLSSQQQHYLNTILDNPWTISQLIIDINHESLGSEAIPVILEGERYLFRKRRITVRDHDDYSWSGVLDDQSGRVSLVVNGDMVTGTIRTAEGLYAIYPLGEGLHVLATTHEGAYPGDCPKDYGPEDVRKQGPGDPLYVPDPAKAGEGMDNGSSLIAEDCRVRVLVAFTDDVAAAYADPHGLVQGSIDDHNDANANSEVNHRVELARSMMVNYDESIDSARVFLDDFEGTSDGNMDQIHSDRQLFDADMCVLLTVKGGGFCGLASGIGSTYTTAFCVCAAGCAIGNHTFAHELGHLHGCRHDPYVDDNEEPYAFAHGYVYNTLSTKWRTIMAYNDQCDCSDEAFPCPPRDERDTPGEPVCPRQQNWSTPDVTLDGVPMGTEELHKNERTLDIEDQNSAAYEAYVINKTVYEDRVIQADEAFDIQGQNSVTTVLGEPLILNNGSRGSLRAEDEILLREGFHARSGSEFRAFLVETCTALSLTGEDEEEALAREEDSLAPGREPETFTVRAFPNPFTAKATIELEFAEETTTTISIYDMFGRLVYTLAQGEAVSPGVLTQYVFDGSGLPAGTYTCVVQSGEKDHTIRLIKLEP